MKPTSRQPTRTTEPVPDPFEITLDFKPTGQPDTRTYNRIINRLFNVTMQAIQSMRSVGQGDKALAIAKKTSQALREYDEDLAEVPMCAARETEDPVPVTLQSMPTTGTLRT